MTVKIRRLRPLLGLSVLLWASLTCSASWADDRISSEFKVTPLVTLTKNEKRAVSLAAGGILNHVQQARTDIQYSEGKNALTHVEEGLALVRIIERVLPEYSVSMHIKSGDVTYKEQEKRKQSIVPMYGELDQVFGITPSIRRAKREAFAKGSEEPGAEAELPYTASFLDVRDAKHYLEQAEAAAKKGDTQKADKALASIQEHVIFQYDVIDVPLATARRSLLEAARMVVADNYPRAKQELLRAVASLEVYRSQAGQGVDKELDSILAVIKRVTGTMEEKKQGTVETIQNLWEKVTNLS
jgi:hypothetical protein